jgi:hypothetical protein
VRNGSAEWHVSERGMAVRNDVSECGMAVRNCMSVSAEWQSGMACE